MRSSSSSLRRLAAKTVGCLAVTLAAGCGSAGGGQPAQPEQPVSPGRALALAAKQATQVNSFASTLHVRISGTSAAALSGTMQYRAKPLLTQLNLTIGAGGQKLAIKEIITGSAVYMNMPVLTRQIGKPWLMMTFAQLRNKAGINLSQLFQQTSSNDPFNQTRMLAVSKNARVVGTQVIDGVPTTEYAGSYPAALGLRRLPPSLRSHLQPQIKALGLRTVKFHIWLDAQHHTRRVITDEIGSKGSITSRVDTTAINQPVTVTIPPPSLVAPLPAGA